MFLIFDTETTGLPRDYNAPVSDSSNWPRIVQIAWQLHDATGKLIQAENLIVKPEGFTIPFNAEQVHGISTKRALEEGYDLQSVIDKFLVAVENCTYLCGHNVVFDINVVAAELFRLRIDNVLDQKKIIDTKSEEVTNFCAIPGGKGGKFKWPTLTELYVVLFSESFEEAHNAAFDVAATARAFFEILKKKIVSIDEWTSNEASAIIYQAPELSQLLQVEKDRKNLVTETDETKDNQSLKEVIAEEFSFSHLHNHTQFSVLQSTSDIDEMVKKAAEIGSEALAITDHGNMYGAFLFWQSVKKMNGKIAASNAEIESGKKLGVVKPRLKPIIGCELFICKNRADKSNKDNGFTQVFLAKNKKGFTNLSKLSSIGFTEGFYYVPRIDRECLLLHKEGLIATTGGLQSEIPNLILNVGETQAEEAFLWWKEQFGDDFYVELNRHHLPEENHVNTVLLEFARKYDVRYFAANNNYYIEKNGSSAHDILLCVKEGELQETPIGKGRGYRFGFPNDQFYFKSKDEMIQLFADIPEAIKETSAIVSKVEEYKLEREILLPKFNLPLGFASENQKEINESFERIIAVRKSDWESKNVSQDEISKQKIELFNIAEQFIYLKHLTYEGARRRYPELTADTQERIDFELATIEKMGFPGYFLIVSDFTSKAREMGVSVGPGRGSAAGSVIAYCLGITNVDPVKYDLLFERFLNPDRISMPDIDIDFDDEGRDKVIRYVTEKYGYNQVAQIITYGTMGGKSAIRDAARVMNLPLIEADKLAKSFPETMEANLKDLLKPEGIDKSYLEKIKERKEFVDQSVNFRKLAEDDNLQSKVLKQAYELEGCVRNIGIHACGIIITPDELSNFVPVCKAKDNEMLVTQFDNSVAESAGLLKMDFLGLKTLTIIKDALRLIKSRHGIEIDIDAIPLDDKKTLALFARGETNGIFQFESAGMQKYLRELKSDSFTDLIAMNALFRPGPLAYIPNYINRKHGREEIVYDLPGMEEYLKETFGITVYQEQVMRLSQKLAGFSKGDADVLRKAMGKKQKDTLDKMKAKFLEGCAKNELPIPVCEKVWTDWEAFASYAFNKSHSTCYAYIAFQTGYLKANYPSEFMASVLSNNMGDIKNVTFYMEECKQMGVPVLGPDINESIAGFSVNPAGQIRFGMAAIKGVGANVVDAIVANRNENGKFKNIFDLAERLDSRAMNRRSIESLALAGAFDSFPGIKRSMFFIQDNSDKLNLTDKLLNYGKSVGRSKSSDQISIFGDETGENIPMPNLPIVEEWGTLEQLAKEKEVVGFYISGHPLDDFRYEIDTFARNNLNELSDLSVVNGKDFSFPGIVTSVSHKISKNGKHYAQFVLEDYQTSHSFFVFGEDYVKFRNYLVENFFLNVKGKVQHRTNFNGQSGFEFKISKIGLLADLKEKGYKGIKIKLGVSDFNESVLDKFQVLMKSNPGSCALELTIEDSLENVSVNLFSKSIKVDLNNEFLNELKKTPGLSFELKS